MEGGEATHAAGSLGLPRVVKLFRSCFEVVSALWKLFSRWRGCFFASFFAESEGLLDRHGTHQTRRN